MTRNPQADDNSFLFQVDILVSAKSNGEALEKLLRVLNAGEFEDFRIGSGIQLGKVIEEALAQEKKKPSPPAAPAGGATPALKATAAALKAQADESKGKSVPASDSLEQRIQQYIQTNKLIRLNVNKGRGVKLSMPCRILGYDNEKQLITVYHVDEKQVHSLKLFEIDDFLE